MKMTIISECQDAIAVPSFRRLTLWRWREALCCHGVDFCDNFENLYSDDAFYNTGWPHYLENWKSQGIGVSVKSCWFGNMTH